MKIKDKKKIIAKTKEEPVYNSIFWSWIGIIGALAGTAGVIAYLGVKNTENYPTYFKENIQETRNNIMDTNKYQEFVYDNGYDKDSMEITGSGCKLLGTTSYKFDDAEFSILGKIKKGDIVDTFNISYLVSARDFQSFMGNNGKNTTIDLKSIVTPTRENVNITDLMTRVSKKADITDITIFDHLRTNANEGFKTNIDDVKAIYPDFVFKEIDENTILPTVNFADISNTFDNGLEK